MAKLYYCEVIDISTGILIYVSGLKNLYRKEVDGAYPVAGKLSSLEILFSRFSPKFSGSEFAVVMPEDMRNHALSGIAESLDLKIFYFDQQKVVEKPLSFKQQRWGLEDDTGCDSWVGAAISVALNQLKWSEFVLISLENLLVEPSAVFDSLKLFHHEGFEICFSGERQTGANWSIFQTDVIKALMVNHEDLMWARGGLAWAVRKPLYPFNTGTYHCPRIRARIQCDLRLNSLRTRKMYDETFTETFSSIDFSYEDWLANSSWEKHYLDDFPMTIVVEPSGICQAQCFACPKSTMQRKPGLMTLALFKKLINDMPAPEECRFIFSGTGEPLLNPALSDMISHVEKSSSMLITSLQKTPAEDFNFPALDQLRISVDALEPVGFDKKRPGCNWKNIEAFISTFSSRKAITPDLLPELGVSFVRHGQNETEALSFLKYWKRVAKPIFSELFFKWPFNLPTEKIQWFQILGENSFLGQVKKTSQIDFTPVRRRPCRHALLSATVLWDGSVTICPFDSEGQVIIGNINENSLLEIWQSPLAKSIRASHLQTEKRALPEICSDCIDWYHNL